MLGTRHNRCASPLSKLKAAVSSLLNTAVYISVSLIAAIFTGVKGTIFRSVLSSAEVFQGSSSSAPHSRVPSVPAGQAGSGGGAGTWF